MSKRPENLETVLLSIEILRRIPRVGAVTAQQLHQALHDAGFVRDVRTIQRLLEQLSSHFDIERDDRSKPYGYRWKAHSTGLSLTRMTPQESLLLHLAEQHLGNLLPTRVRSSLQSFFEQAHRTLLHESHARLEREWAKKSVWCPPASRCCRHTFAKACWRR